MNRDWWIKFPIFLAIFFCLYAYGLIHNSLSTYAQLKEKEEARIVAENAQRADTFGDYLREERRFAAELARGPELGNFLANRALGMSLQYGLQSSLDAVAEAFLRAMSERKIGDEALYTGFVFRDASGATLVDTRLDRTLATPATGSDLTIDPERALATLVAPVAYRGVNEGLLMVSSDLAPLLRFLLPAPDTAPYRVILLTPEGHQVKTSAMSPDLTAPLLKKISQMADGRIEIAPESEGRPAIIRHTVPGTRLILASLLPETSLSDSQRDQGFLLIAGLFPPLVLLATLLFERMRRRNAKNELALRASRLRLMAISDNLFEGIALIDEQGRIAFVNRPALRIMGISGEPKDLVGSPIEALLQLPKQNAPWHAAIARGETVIDGDAVLTSPNGQEIAAAYGCTPLMDAEQGTSAIISFRDISALKRAQFETLQSARLVSIGQLAAGIAHEINTPAQYIGDNLAYIEDSLKLLCAIIESVPDKAVLLAGLENPPSLKKLDFMLKELPPALRDSRDGVAQIARIVSSMKEFSHPGSSEHGDTDINRAIENTLAVSRNAWKNLAEVERDFDPTLPMVCCHGGEINQVLLNLILNAAQAIESSGKPLPGRINISTRQSNDAVEIRITDSGNGIPAAIRDRIFDPFFTTKSVGKGSGQGLAICRNVVVVKHGGTIEAGGIEGEGACFTVRLPIEASLPVEE